ncbi:hypothetical protein JTE90_001067 [Oedothorax gibbosus]|uniref:EGF-like domain-containing protein n=1 Tax=Oedothorax gibbosus TaxID=931172 RepID=A0AAV6TJS7_9ARAC|nr:hypothetical protein JTE90_001067 [Oedothorax gibbosus]
MRIEEGVGHCQCVAGLSGDKCNIIEECETGKLKNCNTNTGGKCEFLIDKAVCDCGSGKGFDPTLEKCRDTCKLPSDCSNSMECRIEEGVGHCQCVAGLSGDKCNIIEECETGKLKNCNTNTGGKCEFLIDKAVCDCGSGKGFDPTLEKCRGMI